MGIGKFLLIQTTTQRHTTWPISIYGNALRPQWGTTKNDGPFAPGSRRLCRSLIFSRTWEEHLEHLRQVFVRSKCEFATSHCGHVIGGGVVRPKLSAVQSFPIPKTKTDVRAFLGLTGYYRRFTLPWLLH